MKTMLEPIYNQEQQDDPLQNQFNHLQIEWDSIKQSISETTRRRPTTVADHRLFQLYSNNSPKKLISLLQHDDCTDPPSSGFENGVNGTRVFEESDVGSCDDEKSEGIMEFWCGGFEDESCGSCTDSTPCEEAERGVMVAVVESGGGGGGGGGSSGSVGRLVIWVVLNLIMFAFVIVAFKRSGEDGHRIVPT